VFEKQNAETPKLEACIRPETAIVKKVSFQLIKGLRSGESLLGKSQKRLKTLYGLSDRQRYHIVPSLLSEERSP